MSKRLYAFDLDGTITKEEILPVIAKELNMEEEITKITNLTLSGEINFRESFMLRVNLLKKIPISRIQEIVKSIELDKNIENFIHKNKESCVIITGNLDLWIEPVLRRLNCKYYCSKGKSNGDKLLGIDTVLIKDMPIKELRNSNEYIISVGDSFNDIPMFLNSDVCIAFGGIHNPIDELINVSNYVIYRGDILCKLLEKL